MFILERIQNLSQSNHISGRVIVNTEDCTGCKNCVMVCPAGALELKDKKSQMIENSECISCGACVAVCNDDCIKIATFWKVPDGAYQTLGRTQTTSNDSYPRSFE